MPAKFFKRPLALLLICPSSALIPTAAHAQGTAQATQLSLDEAMALAMTRDADVDRAKRSLEIAKLQVANAKANYLPNASVTVSVNQSATGSAYQSGEFSSRRGLAGNFVGSLSGNVSMPIDISGSIKRQVEAAKLQRGMAELGDERAKRDAIIDVQIAYLSALQAQHMVEVDQSIVASLEGLKSQARTELPSILLFLDVELAGSYEMASMSRAAADQAKDALKLALRLPFELEVQLTSPIPELVNVPGLDASASSESNLDVQSASRRVAAADLAVEQAKDQRRPSLRVGAYATQTLSGRFVDELGRTTNGDYGLNVALNWPLFNYDAGRSGNSIKASALMAEQAGADLELTKMSAELGVRQAKMARERALKRLSQLPDPKAAAQALANATRALFAVPPESAPAIIAQVSNARASWRSAQAAVTDARIGAVIAALRLSKALGTPIRLGGSATTL